MIILSIDSSASRSRGPKAILSLLELSLCSSFLEGGQSIFRGFAAILLINWTIGTPKTGTLPPRFKILSHAGVIWTISLFEFRSITGSIILSIESFFSNTLCESIFSKPLVLDSIASLNEIIESGGIVDINDKENPYFVPILTKTLEET